MSSWLPGAGVEAWELRARSAHGVDTRVHSGVLHKYVHIESQFEHGVQLTYSVRHKFLYL